MSWTPLGDRLDQLPLILAGPILRRTEPDAVTVWLALRCPCQVTLQIYATQAGEGRSIGQVLLVGERETVAIGKHLHLVAVTARSDGSQLESEKIYAYDLQFQTQPSPPAIFGTSSPVTPILSLQQALRSQHCPLAPISYFEHELPTFLLPPQNINQLKLLHGSCRKTHGGGIDALPIVDDLLAHSAPLTDQRPHQLFFTGDQIYGDDVADPWLFALTDAGDTLLGWEESLPIEAQTSAAIPPLKGKHLPPGQRTSVSEQLAGLTAGLYDKPDHTNSHLLSFGEYCAAYLFTWSPVLWPDQFPSGQSRYRDRKTIRTWDQEVSTLDIFYHSLWKVRRALANIPTYMIFDDHDISDDWYLNQAWCQRVLGKPLGRRVVQNGLLAYALCQAWGNTPHQFELGQVGDRLLKVAQEWLLTGGENQPINQKLARLLGLPDADPNGLPQLCQDGSVWILDHPPDSMQWHYTIRSSCHEVVVLDTRTWRGYPMDEAHISPPMLLSPTAFDRQIRQPLQASQGQGLQAIVIAPTNLMHLRLIDWAQEWSLKQGKVFNHDVGDAWNLHKEALSALLAVLFEHRDRVVVLSGDIHYGFAARLNYWTKQPEDKEKAQVLVQLTSSAFKNAELKTQIIQTKLKWLLPEPPQEWVGWHQAAELWRQQPAIGRSRWVKQPPVDLPYICQRPIGLQRWLRGTIAVGSPASLPDWHYRVEWIHRQPARSVPWEQQLGWLKYRRRRQQPSWKRWLGWLGWVWNNRWVQEGREVVGESNIGLVQFRGFNPSGNRRNSPVAAPIVLQDLYWCPPWQPDGIVVSRFDAQLCPAEAADPLPIVPPQSRLFLR
ncbi:MAG: PhoD-like phosphatase [Elainella sp. Prado103]|jgi:hypothetical protein|nr:PhoD-like phosphatase [Elainella sp. Prado103]